MACAKKTRCLAWKQKYLTKIGGKIPPVLRKSAEKQQKKKHVGFFLSLPHQEWPFSRICNWAPSDVGTCKVSASKGMQWSKYHAGEAPSESFFVFFCSIPINATPQSCRWFHAMGMPNTTILPARFHLALVGLEVGDLPTDWLIVPTGWGKVTTFEVGELQLVTFLSRYLFGLRSLHFSFPEKGSGLIGVGLGSSSSCLVPRWQIWGGTHDKWFYAPNLKIALRKNGYKVRFGAEMPNKSLNIFWTISWCPIKR